MKKNLINKIVNGNYEGSNTNCFRVAKGDEYYTVKFSSKKEILCEVKYVIENTYSSAKYDVDTLFCICNGRFGVLELVNNDKVIVLDSLRLIDNLNELDDDTLIEIHNSFFDEQLKNSSRNRIEFMIAVNDDMTKTEIINEIMKIEEANLIPRQKLDITEHQSDAVKNDYRFYKEIKAEILINNIMRNKEYISNKYEVLDRALYLTEEGLVVLELFNSKHNYEETETYTISENQELKQFSKRLLLRIADNINEMLKDYNESI